MFAPCERVIIAQGDNSVSLISILQNVTVTRTPGAPSEIPANLVLPMQWAIFTMWQKEPDDEGTNYTQRVVLMSPSDRSVLESVTAFTLDKEWHRVVSGIVGLPAGEAGIHTLKLSLRREAGNWNEIAYFPLTIKHPSTVLASTRTH